jgi:hypothetical protein
MLSRTARLATFVIVLNGALAFALPQPSVAEEQGPCGPNDFCCVPSSTCENHQFCCQWVNNHIGDCGCL